MQTKQGYNILRLDPLLAPFARDISLRMQHYEAMREKLVGKGGSLRDFANAHMYYGFHQTEQGWVYREWAPGAEGMRLVGDFNGWDPEAGEMQQEGDGGWQYSAPGAMPHGSKVRVLVLHNGEWKQRIPVYTRRAIQDPESFRFDGQIWAPEPYEWRHKGHKPCTKPLLIYECHIGMSGEQEGIATYTQFTAEVLPRVKKLGYNAVQIMAIMEHPYYASFGYQVANFFAVSSRFGTPEEFKVLVDTAHGMGISVLLDLVHSHAAINTVEGIAEFDGTDYQYFHSGTKGIHPQWGSRLFNYGKPQVLHFLLSNLKYWLEEYRLDGFRFDGVTSMLYRDHGVGSAFDSYKKYFSTNTDLDAVTYLQLASELCHTIKKDCVLVAEDMSGMPGMCIPLQDGGIGFDYRLGMGVPDYWINTLQRPDEDWDTGLMWHELNQRRPGEKVVGYCESHDQALVGDKTIMFRLADAEMYWKMNKGSESLVIDRAMALHKMIRLITCICAGEGYLNFMGNEFGHPEWIDFPTEYNEGSYAHARRQWSLADSPFLRYGELRSFDEAMIRLAKQDGLLANPPALLLHDPLGKVLVFRKESYLFLFNFHPTRRFNAAVKVWADSFAPVLDTAWEEFGGYAKHSTKKQDAKAGVLHQLLDPRRAMVLKQK